MGVDPQTTLTCYTAVIGGVLGAVIGSWLTAVLYRLRVRESLLGRSACPRCGTPIRARDNIPIIGWCLLGGRCRACRARISACYPLIELAACAVGVVFALAAPVAGLIVAAAAIVVPVVASYTWRRPRRAAG